MPIVVSDTSIIIDLERGDLLEACFRLEHEMAVPDLLFKQELAAMNGDNLISLGLRIEELTPAEVEAAQQVRADNPVLSFADAFAYTLARSRGWPLLTGDGALRALCEGTEHPFHEVLWVCDKIFEAEVIEAPVLAQRLEQIAAHPRCRLPRSEVNVRLRRYAGEAT